MKKMDKAQNNRYSYKVGEEGRCAFGIQDGANKVTDSQGFVYGNIDKRSNHVDKSKSQVISFQPGIEKFYLSLSLKLIS